MKESEMTIREIFLILEGNSYSAWEVALARSCYKSLDAEIFSEVIRGVFPKTVALQEIFWDFIVLHEGRV